MGKGFRRNGCYLCSRLSGDVSVEEHLASGSVGTVRSYIRSHDPVEFFCRLVTQLVAKDCGSLRSRIFSRLRETTEYE